MTPKQVDARLAQVSPQYTAIFEAAEDGTVDDQFAVLLCGVRTRWTILLGDGYASVAEHGVEPRRRILYGRSRRLQEPQAGGRKALRVIERQPVMLSVPTMPGRRGRATPHHRRRSDRDQRARQHRH